MQSLAPGMNHHLSQSSLMVFPPAGADVLLLLLGNDERMHSDPDLVFYNQPMHPSRAATVTPQGGSIDFRALPSSVTKILIALSFDSGIDSLREPNPTATISEFSIPLSSSMGQGLTVVIAAEAYLRNGQWKIRSVVQGYGAGLEALVRNYGLATDEGAQRPTQSAPSPAPTAAPAPRQSAQTPSGHPTCPRCGGRMKRSILSRGAMECKACQSQLKAWERRIGASLMGMTPTQMEQEWRAVSAFASESEASEALSGSARAHLNTLIQMIFADGVVEQHEVDLFERWVHALRVQPGEQLTALRAKLARGRQLSIVESGQMTSVQTSGIILPAGEIPYFFERSTMVTMTARGPQYHQGMLTLTSSKVRFAGQKGVEVGMNRVQGAWRDPNDLLAISTTLAKGVLFFQVADSAYAASVATGALRLAHRQADLSSQGGRASRSIPQAVKTAVWIRDAGRCVQCGAMEYLEYDHIIPWSKGGASTEGNLQLLCRRCNAAKSNSI